jgi:two-component system sensor histidine kinase YesM
MINRIPVKVRVKSKVVCNMEIRKSLLAKLLIGMMAAAILPFAISNIFAYKTTADSVENQIIELNQNTLNIGMNNVINYVETLNQLSVSFYYDETLMRFLRSKAIDPSRSLYMMDKVSDLYNNIPELLAVRYINARTGQIFTKTDFSSVGQPLHLPDTKFPKHEGEEWDVTRGFGTDIVNNERVLVLHNPLPDYPRPDVLGLVSLYAGLDEFERLLRPLSDEGAGEATFLHIHKDLKLLYGPEALDDLDFRRAVEKSVLAEQGFVKGAWNGQNGLYVYVHDRYLDLPMTMVKFVPQTVINESANQSLNRSLALQMISLTFVIVFASILSIRTIAPIRRLLRHIAQVETGNFQIELRTNRIDEIGVLEQRFQGMVQRLDRFINQEYRNRLELSTARLKMLQAQINPHFLYNALQSINTMALRRQAYDISDKIAELGAILRYSMDIKTETVPLQKEIEHIESYLSLQTGRFKNKLSYTLSCPEEALGIHVPKMILQPLVENSIIHGIEKGRGAGTLHIGIDLDACLRVRVMDTGKGIPPETVQRLRREYESKNTFGPDQGGIGLLNVLHRLRLHYGSDFDWSVTSSPYEATAVSLLIPLHPSSGAGRQ